MQRKNIAVVLLMNVLLFVLLFGGYTIYQKREKEARWNAYKPSGTEMARVISMPQSSVRPLWELEDSVKKDKSISDAQMQWCVDQTLQSLQNRGRRGATERAWLNMPLVSLTKMTKAQFKMLESVIVPSLTPPQGGTKMDKINAIDSLCLINSPIGEPYLPALLADPDKDVRKRAEHYQQIRAKAHK